MLVPAGMVSNTLNERGPPENTGGLLAMTVMVTAIVSLPPLVSVARTVTEYVALVAAFSAAFVRIWPVEGTMSNDAASVPSSL